MSQPLRQPQPILVPNKKKKQSAKRRANKGKGKQVMKKIGYFNVPQPNLVSPLQAEFNQIMAAYVNPKDETFVRMANQYSSAASAVANPWAIVNQTSNGGPTATGTPDPDMSRDEGMAFIFRDPGRAYILYNPNPAGTAFEYDCYFGVVSSVPASTVQILDNSGWMLPIAYISCNTPTFAPYDQTGMSYIDSARNKYVWTNKNDTVTITFSALAATSSYTVEWFKYTNGEMIKESENVQVGTAAPQDVGAGPFDDAGYRAFRVKVTVNGTNPIPDNEFTYTINAMVINGADAVWEHHALPGFIDNLAAATSVRVASASVLCSNQSAQIYKQGRIAALQVPAGNDWTDIIGFDAVSSSSGATTLPAETGIYSFLKPTQPTDFDYKTVSNLQNGILYDTFVPILPASSFAVVSFNITNSATQGATSTPGQQLFWTFAYGIEYLTRDVWRESKISDANPRVYALALEYLSQMPAIHENPLHIAEILKKLKSVFQTAVQGIVRYGPTALKVASMLA